MESSNCMPYYYIVWLHWIHFEDSKNAITMAENSGYHMCVRTVKLEKDYSI